MQKPLIPENEAERLVALRTLKILDTAPEERFDHIVRIAARLFDVPIAYISFIAADRQWFKASCGLTSTETPRDASFCGHTILQNELLVIPDALLDARFADNPQVTGDPFIRFYAGCPLGIDGIHKVGALCIADRKPRHLRELELAWLLDLAALVQRELSLVSMIELQEQLLDAKDKLLESQRRLDEDVAEAAEYLRSLLPPPLDGEIRTDWRFIPSKQLGGDAFGYRWLDDRHFAMYLLDVSGHGVGAALLAASLLNVLGSSSLQSTDFCDPAALLTALNAAFPMEAQGDKFFTIWYGVYDRKSRILRYANGGHPPAVLLTNSPSDTLDLKCLGDQSLMVGAMSGTRYTNRECEVTGPSTLYLYSDGAYEIGQSSGSMLQLRAFMDLLASHTDLASFRLDEILSEIRRIDIAASVADDISILQVTFP